jgi:hypothetical protein
MSRLSSVLAVTFTAVAIPHAAASFFAPQPNNDPSLTPGPRVAANPLARSAPVPPQQAEVQAQPQQQAPVPDPAVEIRAAEEQSLRAAEQQMDRVERANDRARGSSYPAPIVGAFDGLTSERDR